jgi:DNA-binding response OmpR family regulator
MILGIHMISVLYVENETALLEIGKFFLEKDGSMEVDTCLSIYDALKKISAKHYDIIISEYATPMMNGIEFLKSLRSRGDTTPFIIFTKRGRTSVKTEALNQGVDFYLEKAGNAKAHFAEIIREIQQTVERKSPCRKLEQPDSGVISTPETAVSNDKEALQQKKPLYRGIIQSETGRIEGIASHEPFSESNTERKIETEEVSCRVVPGSAPAKEPDAVSLTWDVDDKYQPPGIKGTSHDDNNYSRIWEIDDITGPVEGVNKTHNYQRFFSKRKLSSATYAKIGIGVSILMILTALYLLPNLL